jgi:hypothetical protein
MKELLKSYVGKKIFISRGFPVNSLDCGIFTDKNIGGYGKGIRGDYFWDDENFKDALSEKGDSLKRRVFTLDNLEKLKQHLGVNQQLFNDDNYFKNFVKDLIIKTRNSYCSDNPKQERKEKVYVEINELFLS